MIPQLGRSPGEGNGNPLQNSGLENSMDGIVHGVAKTWTQLSDFHFISLLSLHSEYCVIISDSLALHCECLQNGECVFNFHIAAYFQCLCMIGDHWLFNKKVDDKKLMHPWKLVVTFGLIEFNEHLSTTSAFLDSIICCVTCPVDVEKSNDIILNERQTVINYLVGK